MRVTNKIKAEQIAILGQVYKDTKPALRFGNPFELLVAVILSAQCTDVRVNITTERLFAKAPTPQAIIDMGLEALEAEIKDCGLFRNKAKNIMATCRILVSEYQGQVPEDFEALLKLPGVGRKTANVVSSIAFNRPAIAVDTHVFRLANRIGLAQKPDVLKTELALMKLLPEEHWIRLHHALIWHGRQVCTSRNPKCGVCGIADLCRKNGLK